MTTQATRPSKHTIIVDIFLRAPDSHSLYNAVAWYSEVSNARGWSLIEEIRLLLTNVDSEGFYIHNTTTQEETYRLAVIDGITEEIQTRKEKR